MNILNNIHAKSLLIRTFLTPDPNSVLSDFPIEVPVLRISETDPQFVQYAPFGSGYNITVILTTCADLRYIADQHLLAELVVVPGGGNPMQIGSSEGFQLVGVVPPSSPEQTLYTYTFQTNKPNKYPYVQRIF